MSGYLKTMAVWITEIPSFVQAPTFPNPNAQLKFLTQQFPDQWINFIDFLVHEGHCSDTTAKALQRLQLEQIEQKERGLLARVDEWMDFRMPTFKRTCAALCAARDRVNAGKVVESFTIAQILWPKVIRENDPANAAATRMGIEIVPHDPQSAPFDYALLLEKSRADILWIIPGGMKLNLFTLLVNAIKEVLRSFEMQPSAAAFYDRHSTIHRASALREIVKRRNSLPWNREKAIQVMLDEGYSIIGHPYAEPSFSSIEPIYVRSSRE